MAKSEGQINKFKGNVNLDNFSVTGHGPQIYLTTFFYKYFAILHIDQSIKNAKYVEENNLMFISTRNFM